MIVIHPIPNATIDFQLSTTPGTSSKKRDRAARTPPTVRAESNGHEKPKAPAQSEPLPVFLPARVELSSQATIEIVLADGMTVRIPDDFNERTLDSVLTVLERRAC